MRSNTKYMYVGGTIAKVKATICPVNDHADAISIEAYDLTGKEVYLTASETTEACEGL